MRYGTLLRVEARHEYFADGVARGVVFEPTAAAGAAMRSLGLLSRPEGATLTVLRPEPATAAGAAAEPTTLLFKVIATDLAIGTYTEIGSGKPDHLYWFDSAAAGATDTAGSRALSAKESVGSEDLRAVDDAAVVSALDVRERRVPPLGLLALRVTAADLQADRPGPDFHLLFRSRRTLWKYIVLGAPSGVAPTIRDADGNVAFEPAGAAQVPGGREAVTLRSTEPIALRERGTQRFQLRAQTSAGERVLVKRLAVASPGKLGRDTVDGREVAVSEIYINL
jgi:hypothetical protein